MRRRGFTSGLSATPTMTLSRAAEIADTIAASMVSGAYISARSFTPKEAAEALRLLAAHANATSEKS